jgi:hypothetical protein
MYQPCEDSEIANKKMVPLRCDKAAALEALMVANVYCVRHDFLADYGGMLLAALRDLTVEVREMSGPRPEDASYRM